MSVNKHLLGLGLLASCCLIAAPTVGTKHVIDCDAVPMIPKDWTIHTEDQIQSRVRGPIDLDPSKIALYLADGQKNSFVRGHDLKLVLDGEPVLPANVLDCLLRHQELIPDSWKDKEIIFWGTIYRVSNKRLAVRYLGWYGGKWHWLGRHLSRGFDADSPAVVSAN